MAVVSVSIPDELLRDVDSLIGQGMYRGRSEALRTAARLLLQERHTVPRGHVHGTITLLYEEGHEARISEVRHAFHDIILSLMHTHCEPEVCMDVLIVGGSAARVHELHDTLQRMRSIERAVLVPFARGGPAAGKT